jgi:flavodoxin
MKVIIIYYSFTGHTKKVAEALKDYLIGKGHEVELLRLKPLDEENKFLKQAVSAFRQREVKLPTDIQYDFNDYDLIIIGSPVWAFSPVPAIRSYVMNTQNIENKKFCLFVTHGSGLGKLRCLNIMASFIEERGGVVVDRFAIRDIKVNDLDFLNNIFADKIR